MTSDGWSCDDNDFGNRKCRGRPFVIRIKILNHAEVVTAKGGMLGYVGKGLSAIGLMDLNLAVEKKIAGMIENQLRQQGVQVEIGVGCDDSSANLV